MNSDNGRRASESLCDEVRNHVKRAQYAPIVANAPLERQAQCGLKWGQQSREQVGHREVNILDSNSRNVAVIDMHVTRTFS